MKHFEIDFKTKTFIIKCKYCKEVVCSEYKNMSGKERAETAIKAHLKYCKEYSICWRCENARFYQSEFKNMKNEKLKVTNYNCAKKHDNCFKLKKISDCKILKLQKIIYKNTRT